MSSDGNGGSYQGENQTKRIRLYQQENEVDINREQPSTSLDLEQVGLAQERQKNRSKSDENKKLTWPANNYRIIRLRIGQWETIPSYASHLNAKIYFRKKQLAWEIFDSGEGLRKIIRFSWSDILAIRSKLIVNDDQPSVLEIVLNREPSFQSEIRSEHRTRQAQWKDTVDFTRGEASKERIHVVEFPPGRLNKYYEMLLKSDTRLAELSRKPFPSQILPFLQPINEPQYNNDAALALGREMNPSTSISDTTIVQPLNYSQNNPKNYAEQTPMLTHPDMLNPQIQPKNSTDIENILNNIRDMLEEPMKPEDFPPEDECERLERELRMCL